MQTNTYHALAARPAGTAPMDALDFVSNTLIGIRKLGKDDTLVFDRNGRIAAAKVRTGWLASRLAHNKIAKQKAEAISHFVRAFEELNAHHVANSAVGNSGLRRYLDDVKNGQSRLTAAQFTSMLDACRRQLLEKIAPGNVSYGRSPVTPPVEHAVSPTVSAPYSPDTMRDPARFNTRFDQDLHELEALLKQNLFPVNR